MAFPKKRQQVMFAKAIEIDILYNYHFIVMLIEYRVIQQLLDIFAISLGQKFVSLCNTVGSSNQSFPFGIFANFSKYIYNAFFKLFY